MQRRLTYATILLLVVGAICGSRMRSLQELDLGTVRHEAAEYERRAQKVASERAMTLAELELSRREFMALEADEAAAADGRESELRTWLRQTATLQRLFVSQPDQSIPELALLTERDWLRLSRDAKFQDEIDIRKTLAAIRADAKKKLADIVGTGLQKYAEAHNGLLPEQLGDVADYTETPLDPAVFQRYRLRLHGLALTEIASQPVVEIAPVDSEYDTRLMFGPDSFGSGRWRTAELNDAMSDAMQSYRQSNPGKPLEDPSQFLPYVASPVMRELLQALAGYSQAHSGRDTSELTDIEPYLVTSDGRAAAEKIWGK